VQPLGWRVDERPLFDLLLFRQRVRLIIVGGRVRISRFLGHRFHGKWATDFTDKEPTGCGTPAWPTSIISFGCDVKVACAAVGTQNCVGG
jgi:hypothetical protein